MDPGLMNLLSRRDAGLSLPVSGIFTSLTHCWSDLTYWPPNIICKGYNSMSLTSHFPVPRDGLYMLSLAFDICNFYIWMALWIEYYVPVVNIIANVWLTLFCSPQASCSQGPKPAPPGMLQICSEISQFSVLRCVRRIWWVYWTIHVMNFYVCHATEE